MYGMGGGFNVWTWIILILIVLQWFRVGGIGGGGIPGVPGGPGPEHGLVNNGGLFIIAIFLLVACSCFKHQMGPIGPARYC
jgi:hypothetical protein